MKRILKITGILILVLLIVLIAAPFLFKGKLENLLKDTINENLNATVSWESIDLSLLSNFPEATVDLKDFMVITHAPFQGDTLAMGSDFKIQMGVKQLFKKANNDPINVDAIQLDNALIQIKVNADGVANYDIAKKSTSNENKVSSDKPNTSKPFSFDINHYEINDSEIIYRDEDSETLFKMRNLTHQGNGDFSTLQSTLSTETVGDVTVEYGGTNYVNNQRITLDANIDLDLENQKYTFKENSATINALPLVFNGYVQLIDEGTQIDLDFNTPNSDFKNFLAVIPQEYAKNLDGVDTSGDFSVSGKIKGASTDTTIPMLDIAIVSNNASFKYPELPKKMENIDIDTRIKNTTGLLKDTYVLINKLHFKIDNDEFAASGSLKNLTQNLLADLALKGTLNLANIEKVYPLNLDTQLSGILEADVTTNFDMASIEKHDYEAINSQGILGLKNFNYSGKELNKPIAISDASVNFTPRLIELQNFEGKTGNTDIKATGTIENLIPFMLSKEDLKGRFKLDSQVFDLNDFATTEDVSGTNKSQNQNNTSAIEEAHIEIPDFLDANIDFTAQKVIYDDLTLENMKGSLAILEEQASLSELTSSLFGGQAGISGKVSTQNSTPTFDVSLDLNKLDIDQSFQNISLLSSLAPIAKALQGLVSSKINLTGSLDNNMAPILSTIEGSAQAQLQTTEINSSQMPLISTLDEQLDFINLGDLKGQDFAASLSFKEGKVIVAPFNFELEGIAVNVEGGHSFENVLDYNLVVDVPARYLGNEVSSLLAKLTKEEKESLHVPLAIDLGGSFLKPSIGIDSKSAITNLTSQIIEIQKQHLKDKGNDIIKDVIDDVVSDKVGDGAGNIIKDVVGDVLGNKNKPQDSINTSTPGDSGINTNTIPKAEDVIKDAANDIFGGLFGNKNKNKTKKDSIN